MTHNFNIVWLTGVTGSGKSTLSEYVNNNYQKGGYNSRIIDGDGVRNKDIFKLGFSRKDVRTILVLQIMSSIKKFWSRLNTSFYYEPI